MHGFLTQDEKALFEKLISVSDIGPTLAIKILSGLAAPDLILSIRRGEVEKLVKVPGSARKTAERMVLELRDKLPATGSDEPGTPPGRSPLACRSGRALRPLQSRLRARKPKPPSARPKPPEGHWSSNPSSAEPWSRYANPPFRGARTPACRVVSLTRRSFVLRPLYFEPVR